MLAVVQQELGDSGVLELTEVPRPVPGPGEVLIRVAAAGVNPVDAVVRSGRYSPRDGRAATSLDLRHLEFAVPPFTLGWDVAGTVHSLGAGVSEFDIGDRVLGLLAFPDLASTHAEYVVASCNEIVRWPQELGMAEAGALPLAGLTAWQALVGIGGVTAGQRVLVHAAAGGVGHLAVQIARERGADVFATASASKHELVASFGADEVIDYRTQDFATEIAAVDFVLDLVGGDYAARSLRVLRPGGHLVSAVTVLPGMTSREAAQHDVTFSIVHVRPSARDLAALVGLGRAGRLRVHVAHQFTLSEAAEAHRVVESGRATGKVVLVPC